jgi:hypothetical protein
MHYYIEQAVNDSLESLDDNDSRIDQYRDKMNEIYTQQEQKFLELADKLYPIITHLKKQKYPFYNEEFDATSFRGPVIGRKNNTLFIYEGEGRTVTVGEANGKEVEQTTLQIFLREHSFKSAMEGLLKVTNTQNHILNKIQKKIDDMQEELTKY